MMVFAHCVKLWNRFSIVLKKVILPALDVKPIYIKFQNLPLWT